MTRQTLNFVVDSLAFAAFILLAGSGVLVRYVLPPGSGRVTSVWGLDRHEWGSVHFWLAIGCLAALALHLILHARWVVGKLRGRKEGASGGRVALGLIGVAALVALAVAPLVSPIERSAGAQRRHPGAYLGDTEHDQIRGAMTLREVAHRTDVPATYLVERLGLPPEVDLAEPLGRLSRAHGFTIHDVRALVRDYEKP